MQVEFLDIAQIELDESFKYYEIQQKQLGYRFVNEIKNAIDRIVYFPSAWQQISQNLRRCLVKNFPYGIIYQVMENKILIVAIANLHRKPNYWANRLK